MLYNRTQISTTIPLMISFYWINFLGYFHISWKLGTLKVRISYTCSYNQYPFTIIGLCRKNILLDQTGSIIFTISKCSYISLHWYFEDYGRKLCLARAHNYILINNLYRNYKDDLPKLLTMASDDMLHKFDTTLLQVYKTIIPQQYRSNDTDNCITS